MTLNEKIIAVVTPIVPVCVPDLLVTEAGETPPETYCTFSYTEKPDLFADNLPLAIVYQAQLHLYLPLGENPIALKRGIRGALLAAGCAVSNFDNYTDLDGQHYVLDFEWSDEEVS